ncbi:MAG: hypothetical protein ACYCWE_20425 [Eubacteriales bacterium]
MVKGFIFYQHGKIPFVIDKYIMELFTDDSLLSDFTKEYNFKKNYIIKGQCFYLGSQPQKITILVEHSIGSNCYMSCYLIDSISTKNGYDTIGIQSPFLDDIFKYKYNYLDSARNRTNLALSFEEVYKVPFQMDNKQYELTFRIGHNGHLGLLEDFDKKGEVLISLTSGEVQECYNISIVLQRFAMFMVSHSDVSFKRVTLYNKGLVAGWFYCNLVSDKSASAYDFLFCEFDVMKYVPKILNNIALDSGNKITTSVPLGHLTNTDSMFAPQRFIEQIMAFEYLFEKLEPQKANNNRFPLKDELKSMFESFPDILSKSGLSSADISEELKTIRVDIVHGYSYYYDFKTDSRIQYMIMKLDKLIQNMSLKWIGFSQNDIDKCIRFFI